MSDTDTEYVIVWRDTPSAQARLRTYTDTDDTPLAYLLDALSPRPDQILETSRAVDSFLASDSTLPAAIPAQLARSILGWGPRSAT